MSAHNTRMLWAATRTLILLTVILGIGYPGVVTAVGQLAFPRQAGGSMLTAADGTLIGSSLIGQSFTDAEGNPIPRYFQSRPSAAGDGYEGASSSGSNLGPESPDLAAAITERRAQIAAFNNVAPESVPADALTASGSGLDPHISPAYADLQAKRVAAARGLDLWVVDDLIRKHTSAPDFGFLGESTVNVVELNLALDNLEG